jgi:hypothetical protein
VVATVWGVIVVEGGDRRRGVRRGALLLSGVVLLSACSGGGAADPEASPRDVSTIGQLSEPPAPSPSASAEAVVDVTVVPDEITPAYVDAVANTLYGIADEVTVEILAEPADPSRNLTREQLDVLADVFDLEEYTRRVGENEFFAREEERRANLRDASSFTGLRWETVRIIRADTSCIVAVGYLDLSGTAIEVPPDPILSALSMGQARDIAPVNPTPWVVVDVLLNTDVEGNPNPDSAMLEAEVSTFGDALTHTCEVAS